MQTPRMSPNFWFLSSICIETYADLKRSIQTLIEDNINTNRTPLLVGSGTPSTRSMSPLERRLLLHFMPMGSQFVTHALQHDFIAMNHVIQHVEASHARIEFLLYGTAQFAIHIVVNCNEPIAVISFTRHGRVVI